MALLGPAWAVEGGPAATGAAGLAVVRTPPSPPSSPSSDRPSARADGLVDGEVDPLDLLRERLAARLGAQPAPQARGNVLRVTARPSTEPQAVQAAAAAAAPAPAAARRSPPRAGAHAGGASSPHWGYGGAVGPAAWGGLRPDFGLCASGKRQSPIDIRDGIAVDLEPVAFDYRASAFRVVDTGHTVQVNVAPGNFIAVGGRRYELQQFHFHRPSEERVDGRAFDMVAHLVHKDPDGRLAVVAVLLERGSAQPVVQSVWNNLPLEKGDEVPARTVLDLNHLLPPDRRYYTYMGSLTTPPCSEGVLWLVLRQPVPVSADQIGIFARLYPMNARPVQQAAGRMIKQSN